MSTKQSTIDYLLDQLQDVRNVRARKMFGEFALYCDDKVVALICDDELFVKITPEGKKFLGKKYKEGPPYPGAKPYIHIDSDLYDDRKFLSELIEITTKVLPAKSKSKK